MTANDTMRERIEWLKAVLNKEQPPGSLPPAGQAELLEPPRWPTRPGEQ